MTFVFLRHPRNLRGIKIGLLQIARMTQMNWKR
jgi:hypothetical protein